MTVQVNSLVQYLLCDSVRKQCASALREVFSEFKRPGSAEKQSAAVIEACYLVRNWVDSNYSEMKNTAIREYLLKFAAVLMDRVVTATETSTSFRYVSDMTDYYILILNNAAEEINTIGGGTK